MRHTCTKKAMGLSPGRTKSDLAGIPTQFLYIPILNLNANPFGKKEEIAKMVYLDGKVYLKSLSPSLDVLII